MNKPADIQTDKALQTGELHKTFGHLFRRTHLRSQQAFARAFESCELSPLQFGILELVRLNPSITHGDLAEGMVTAPSVVTTAMKPLLQSRLLIKTPAERDARRSGYELSATGERLFAQVAARLFDAEALLLAPLTEADRHMLKPLLRKLALAGRL